jgi:hypothetical protein
LFVHSFIRSFVHSFVLERKSRFDQPFPRLRLRLRLRPRPRPINLDVVQKKVRSIINEYI